MALKEETVEALIAKYISNNMVLAFGTGSHTEKFLKKLAFKIEDENLEISVVPTSKDIAGILSALEIQTASLNEREIDLAIEFADIVDPGFNYIKRDSSSFVRDKMVAQSAAELIVVTDQENYVKRLHGCIPFEICVFGWKRTLMQLEKLGEAKLRERKGRPFKTETNHYVVDVQVDEIYSLDELEFQAKDVPGVLETGLFIGYADRVLLHNGRLEMKSRLDYSKQNRLVAEEKGLITL
ncbi:MAG: ribose 5-phosphate isomerase A [Candidatus Diapherotrites archaeon]|uniref:Ribose 5-phosphate isomerase A n=1 Tax=Candidatus Iainarchaeum sp. TaxID=3101447 RepID=A0A938YWJ0_9ARCH|nr:ribose 5-phosphate isomerase A [Candidatus Diapherotrites archaeon]